MTRLPPTLLLIIITLSILLLNNKVESATTFSCDGTCVYPFCTCYDFTSGNASLLDNWVQKRGSWGVSNNYLGQTTKYGTGACAPTSTNFLTFTNSSGGVSFPAAYILNNDTWGWDSYVITVDLGTYTNNQAYAGILWRWYSTSSYLVLAYAKGCTKPQYVQQFSNNALTPPSTGLSLPQSWKIFVYKDNSTVFVGNNTNPSATMYKISGRTSSGAVGFMTSFSASGVIGIGYNRIKLEEYDECAYGMHNCSGNATCTNLINSFSCACNYGYEGDGYNCTQIDFCDQLLYATPCIASPIGTCSFVPPVDNTTDIVYSCGCASGYEGDGLEKGNGCVQSTPTPSPTPTITPTPTPTVTPTPTPTPSTTSSTSGSSTSSTSGSSTSTTDTTTSGSSTSTSGATSTQSTTVSDTTTSDTTPTPTTDNTVTPSPPAPGDNLSNAKSVKVSIMCLVLIVTALRFF